MSHIELHHPRSDTDGQEQSVEIRITHSIALGVFIKFIH